MSDYENKIAACWSVQELDRLTDEIVRDPRLSEESVQHLSSMIVARNLELTPASGGKGEA